MLTVSQLSKSFAGRTLFDDVSLQVNRGVNLISDALPFGALWYGEPDAIANAISYAKFRSRSHRAVIRVFDAAGNVASSKSREVFTRIYIRPLPKRLDATTRC